LDGSGQWRIDFNSVELMISSLTKAIVVVNPNNPTGSYIAAAELARLNQLCITHDLALIIDEVFLDYVRPGSAEKPMSVISNNDVLTFTLSGFSKVLALPQAKLSWIHVGGPDPIKEGAKERLEFITDTYLSVNSMIQLAAASLLAGQQDIQRQILARIEANEDTLKRETGLTSGSRQGGWYAILELPDHITDEQCCLELLEQHGIIVHPGFFYDFVENNRIVISLICTEEDFKRGISMLRRYLGTDRCSPCCRFGGKGK
jgi:aspartate/methionine/tyrosine aminotransferase